MKNSYICVSYSWFRDTLDWLVFMYKIYFYEQRRVKKEGY